MNEEVEEAINYFENREISMKVDMDIDKLLKALGVTEEDSFDKQVYRMKTLINRIKELERENGYLRVIKNENEYYTENTNLVTERMIKSIEKNTYKIEISEGNFVDIKELYTKYKELEKERDGIYADYQDLGKAYYDSIPKQVIRDKIEEKQKILDVFTDEMNNAIQEKNQNKFDLYNKGTDNMSLEIQVLKELLEEE